MPSSSLPIAHNRFPMLAGFAGAVLLWILLGGSAYAQNQQQQQQGVNVYVCPFPNASADPEVELCQMMTKDQATTNFGKNITIWLATQVGKQACELWCHDEQTVQGLCQNGRLDPNEECTVVKNQQGVVQVDQNGNPVTQFNGNWSCGSFGMYPGNGLSCDQNTCKVNTLTCGGRCGDGIRQTTDTGQACDANVPCMVGSCDFASGLCIEDCDGGANCNNQCQTIAGQPNDPQPPNNPPKPPACNACGQIMNVNQCIAPNCMWQNGVCTTNPQACPVNPPPNNQPPNNQPPNNQPPGGDPPVQQCQACYTIDDPVSCGQNQLCIWDGDPAAFVNPGNGCVERGAACNLINCNDPFACEYKTQAGCNTNPAILPNGMPGNGICEWTNNGCRISMIKCPDAQQPVCGNTVVEQGEQCDAGLNGNKNAPNACRAAPNACKFPFCGDGITDNADPYREQCDDGNIKNGDGCSAMCESEPMVMGCGNGIKEGAEECDDGNVQNGDGCSMLCKNEEGAPPRCGDGKMNRPQEECDDGNQIDADNCTNICVRRPAGGRCSDGIVQQQMGEQCDDGGNVGGDGCSAQCQNEAAPVCGNGIKEGNEQCDDGNKNNADACSNTCRTNAAGPRCGDEIVQEQLGEQCDNPDDPMCTEDCRRRMGVNDCGNGRPDPGEQCDDGNRTNGDGCSATCRNEPLGPPSCGDGVINQAAEACDDGNMANGDGCSSVCKREPAGGRCSDGIVQQQMGEQCDDGGNVGGDGCSAQCQNEAGAPPRCGDGFINQQNEQCDDKNTLNLDGCSATCQIENPAFGRCGDGILRPQMGEQCDDKNNINGDGCSAQCQKENVSFCGNGVAEQPEQCDDPTNPLCSKQCKWIPVSCGNGKVDAQEQCDDGAKIAGDGCDDACMLECGNGMNDNGAPVVTALGQFILDQNDNILLEQCEPGIDPGCNQSCQLLCGDGVEDPAQGEECDDGNTLDGDGCSSACIYECGNDIKDEGEECDDGNWENGDGCSETCELDLFYCCDTDGVAVEVEDAQTICRQQDPEQFFYDLEEPHAADVCEARFCCGVTANGEQKEFQVAEGDECVGSPLEDADAELYGDPSATPGMECGEDLCGDGVKQDSEECDDGDMNAADGTCTEECTLQLFCCNADGVNIAVDADAYNADPEKACAQYTDDMLVVEDPDISVDVSGDDKVPHSPLECSNPTFYGCVMPQQRVVAEGEEGYEEYQASCEALDITATMDSEDQKNISVTGKRMVHQGLSPFIDVCRSTLCINSCDPVIIESFSKFMRDTDCYAAGGEPGDPKIPSFGELLTLSGMIDLGTVASDMVLDATDNAYEFDFCTARAECEEPENPEVTEECGNAEKEGKEECDDGNTTDGDGCNAQCQEEIFCCSTRKPADAKDLKEACQPQAFSTLGQCSDGAGNFDQLTCAQDLCTCPMPTTNCSQFINNPVACNENNCNVVEPSYSAAWQKETWSETAAESGKSFYNDTAGIVFDEFSGCEFPTECPDTSTPPVAGTCGDTIVEGEETCDDGGFCIDSTGNQLMEVTDDATYQECIRLGARVVAQDGDGCSASCEEETEPAFCCRPEGSGINLEFYPEQVENLRIGEACPTDRFYPSESLSEEKADFVCKAVFCMDLYDVGPPLQACEIHPKGACADAYAKTWPTDELGLCEPFARCGGRCGEYADAGDCSRDQFCQWTGQQCVASTSVCANSFPTLSQPPVQGGNDFLLPFSTLRNPDGASATPR